MSKAQRVHNPIGSEVVYDQAGHILPGHTSTQADLSDPVTARLAGSGRLIVPTAPAKTETRKTTNKDNSGETGEKSGESA